MIGRIHSFQSLGTLDGPGVRFVVFMQGCHLRCGCCHNPDTWNLCEGKEYTPRQVVDMAKRYQEYYKDKGGITISGGEPLLQAEYVKEVFRLCHEEGIHTCLDTSGSVWNQDVEELLDETDRVLLDIKYVTDEDYRKYVGCSLENPLFYLEQLERRRIPVTIRQVIIPTLNDTKESLLALKEMGKAFSCVENIELLPFRKICQVKYDSMGMEFPFGHLPTPTGEQMEELKKLL